MYGMINVGQSCFAVKINNTVLLKNTQGTGYTISSVVNSLSYPLFFDHELNFVYSNGKVYQVNATDYVEAFSVPDLKSTVKIYASSDKKKVVLLSYEMQNISFNSVMRIYQYTT